MKNNMMWMMVLCCGLPLLLLWLAPSLGLSKYSNIIPVLCVAILAICMMNMGKKGGGCCGGHEEKKPDPENKDGEKKTGCH